MNIPNYKILKEIGAGGMGTVYLAEHTLIKRKVAIKSLKQDLIKNDQLRERFKKEATALAQLEHPNIVRLNEYIEQQDGVFLIMEYVDGLPLDEHINNVSGPINEEQLIPLFLQILDAFEYAHKNKIVHRDIKPSNIIITKDGKIKVLDFGIAKIMDETNSMTKTGTQMGSVLYMSPEQVRGEKVNHLSDIYSLGVTLFQMATGEAPYDPTSNEYEVFQKIDKEPLPKASSIYPGISKKLEEIIEKATNKDGSKRFQSCSEFKKVLSQKKNLETTTKVSVSETIINEPSPISKKKFNFYWVFGIVSVILISINLFNPVNTGVLQTNYSEFKSFIDYRQVRKIEVINKKEARVYISTDQLDQPPHKDKNIPKNSVFGGPNNGPHYVFNIPNNESFSSYLEMAQKEYARKNQTLMYDYVEEDNFGKDILGWIIFFGIMVSVRNFVKKKFNLNLPKFNFYWVFGIVSVILISMKLFNPVNTGVLQTNYSEFKSFIDYRQVRKIEVINKKEARVYISTDQLDQPPHKDKNIPKNSVFGGPNNGPHYVFNIPNNESFSSYLEMAQKEYARKNQTLMYDYVEEDNFGKDILGWIIFFGIMVSGFFVKRKTKQKK